MGLSFSSGTVISAQQKLRSKAWILQSEPYRQIFKLSWSSTELQIRRPTIHQNELKTQLLAKGTAFVGIKVLLMIGETSPWFPNVYK